MGISEVAVNEVQSRMTSNARKEYSGAERICRKNGQSLERRPMLTINLP